MGDYPRAIELLGKAIEVTYLSLHYRVDLIEWVCSPYGPGNVIVKFHRSHSPCFSCYVHPPFSVFLSKLSQILEFLRGKESLQVPVYLFVFINDIFTTLNRIQKSYRHISNTMKSWSSNLQGQNILGFQGKM